jgi:hypothetical protein
MKKILYKIIISLSVFMFLGGCHNLEHRKLFFEPNNQSLVNKAVKPKITPIEKVKPKIIAIEKVKPKVIKKKINLQFLINFSENKLYSIIGKGNFVKEAGKLKNIQYYFTKCFLDVFLIKRNNGYHVTLLQIRPILLNGSINKDKCLDEISNKLKTSFN